jgi:hypothetical protein
MRNRLPISRMLGWYVFSLRKSSRKWYTRRSIGVRGWVTGDLAGMARPKWERGSGRRAALL